MDDATFEALLAAAIAGVGGDTGPIEALEASDGLSAKATQKALKALIAAVREAARLGMTPGQIRDDCVEQGKRPCCDELVADPMTADETCVAATGVTADQAEQLSAAFQQGAGQICASVGGQTVTANQVVDMEWSFGGADPKPMRPPQNTIVCILRFLTALTPAPFP